MDLYGILQVPRSASTAEIKSAYRELARTTHPDKGGDARTFQKISAAAETLSHPERRKEYDLSLAQRWARPKRYDASLDSPGSPKPAPAAREGGAPLKDRVAQHGSRSFVRYGLELELAEALDRGGRVALHPRLRARTRC